jgi:M6 family metalloprotease-like protein
MKRLVLLMTLVFLAFGVSACTLISTTPSTLTTGTTSTSTVSTTVSTSNLTTSSTQPTTSTSTTTTTTTQPTTTTTTTQPPTTTTTITTTTNANTPLIPSGYSLLQDELDVVGLPSLGNVNVLVFVVDFPDYPFASADVTLADIDKAYNGSSSEMAYESLASFYQKSSYGKLNINADIYGVYRAPEDSDYYADLYETEYPDSDLLYDLLVFYNGQIDYSDYDANNDGFIDALYIIYTAPVSYDSGSDLWWAYQDIYIYEGDYFDGVEPYYFVWMGTEFLTEGDEPLNARTIIHETGHLLGLEDYYDYDPDGRYNVGGLGGADMMDSTFGDHNPFSKILLGWVVPKVVTQSMVFTLLPSLQNGDVLLVINQWNNTIFDEYLLITYYTPEGLNDDDPVYNFTVSGIVIYHVDAKIDNGWQDNTAYYTIFNNNNSDTRNKLIKFIEADMGGDIDDRSYGWAENTDLFQEGDVLKQNVYPNYRWYDLTKPMNFTIAIGELTSEGIQITIQFGS